MRVVVAITGASGVQYAYRLLTHLTGEIQLIISDDAKRVIEVETDLSEEDFTSLASATYANSTYDAPFASGSYLFDAIVIIPCSMNTLAKVAAGLADNLTTRTASVALKEGRKVIIVPRETPLHEVHLEQMAKLSRLGATILPAMPGFYHRPKSVEDMVDFVVARILDHLGIEHSLAKRWGG